MINAICGKAPLWLINAFLKFGVNLTETGVCGALPSATEHHIDQMAFKFSNSHIFVANESKFILNKLNNYDFSVIDESLGNKYPKDVLLNVCQVGNFLFCNEKYSSKQLISYAKKLGLEIINVSQGYANCSICVVSNSKPALITEDESIYNACALVDGIDALLISKGEVTLEGYDYGFIGGSSALIEDNVYFFGNISSHPDYESIKEFISNHNKGLVELSQNPLTDIGGIIEI